MLVHSPAARLHANDLAEAMQMQKITISRHADRLVRAGWIERRDDATDARAYRLLFRARRAAIDKLAAVADAMRQEFMRGLRRPPRLPSSLTCCALNPICSAWSRRQTFPGFKLIALLLLPPWPWRLALSACNRSVSRRSRALAPGRRPPWRGNAIPR